MRPLTNDRPWKWQIDERRRAELGADEAEVAFRDDPRKPAAQMRPQDVARVFVEDLAETNDVVVERTRQNASRRSIPRAPPPW